MKSIVLFLMFLMSGNFFASSSAPPYPKLTMHGESYENSCSAKEKLELMNSVQKNVMQNSRALQMAIDLILCASDTSQNTKRIINFVDRIGTTIYEGTGEEKVVGNAATKAEVAKDIMAKGRAWNTTLQFNDDEVTLQYFSSEAFVESVKLRHTKKSWLVYAIGGACD